MPLRKDIHTFIAACENLLGRDITPDNLNESEGHVIQYYLSALAAKFPALSN
jgi:hypothetical protein